MQKFKLEIGDSSRDGHGETEDYYIESNKTTEEIEKAYKQSCLLTGLTFSSQEVVVDEVRLDWNNPEAKERRICVDYESYSPSDLAWSILEEYGIIRIDDMDFYQEDLVHLFFEFIQISLPDLTYKIVPDYTPILDVSIGYGLFE